MTLLTAIELAGNYPENVLINAAKQENDKFAGYCYMLHDWANPLDENAVPEKQIHKLMLSTGGVFETEDEATDFLHTIGQECLKEYGRIFSENPDENTDESE